MTHAPGRVEWLELFFDLVVVAAAPSCPRQGPQILVWLLALPVLWQFLYAQRSDALLSLRNREPGAT